MLTRFSCDRPLLWSHGAGCFDDVCMIFLRQSVHYWAKAAHWELMMSVCRASTLARVLSLQLSVLTGLQSSGRQPSDQLLAGLLGAQSSVTPLRCCLCLLNRHAAACDDAS